MNSGKKSKPPASFGHPPGAMPPPPAGMPPLPPPPPGAIPPPGAPLPSPVGSYAPDLQAASQESSGLAVAGMVLSIAAVVGFFLIFLSQLVAFVGVILSIAGLSDVKKNNKTGKGMAITGILVGSIWLAISLATVIFLVWWAQNSLNKSPQSVVALLVATELEDHHQRQATYPNHSEFIKDGTIDLEVEFDDLWEGLQGRDFHENLQILDNIPHKTLANQSFYTGRYAEDAPIDDGDALPDISNLHIWIGYQCKETTDSAEGISQDDFYNPNYFDESSDSYAIVFQNSGEEISGYGCVSSAVGSLLDF